MSDDNMMEKLNELLSDVGRLFQAAVMQKHEYKTNHEISELSLKQAVNDLISCRKQNEILRLSNLHLKNLFATSLKVLSAINFSSNDSIQENLCSLVGLQKLFIELAEKIINFTSSEVAAATNEEEKENHMFSPGPVKIEKPCMKDFNYPAEASTHNEPSTSSNGVLESSGSLSTFDKAVQDGVQNENSLLKQMLLNVNDLSNMTMKLIPLAELVVGQQSPTGDEQVTTTTGDVAPLTAQVVDIIKQKTTSSPRRPEAECHTPIRSEKKAPTVCLGINKSDCVCMNDLVTESPVFKDGVIRRTGSFASEENIRKLASPQLLMNETIVENLGKRSRNSWKAPTPVKEEGKKRKKLSPVGVKDFYSPVKTPPRPLVKSNDREAQLNKSGSKKMLQTRLNVDCFKKNTLTFRESEIKEKQTSKRQNLMEQFQKIMDEEDDFIVDSPVKVLKGSKKENVESAQAPKNSHLSSAVSAVDLDETLVSPSVVQKIAKNHVLENTVKTPIQKSSTNEKSPEYNSVAFPYQRSPVRKKADRKQLQGHSCADCLKYYKNALDDVNTIDLNNLVNRCSRHRNANPSGLEDTPPGYWKPFLTPLTQTLDDKAK